MLDKPLNFKQSWIVSSFEFEGFDKRWLFEGDFDPSIAMVEIGLPKFPLFFNVSGFLGFPPASKNFVFSNITIAKGKVSCIPRTDFV